MIKTCRLTCRVNVPAWVFVRQMMVKTCNLTCCANVVIIKFAWLKIFCSREKNIAVVVRSLSNPEWILPKASLRIFFNQSFIEQTT